MELILRTTTVGGDVADVIVDVDAAHKVVELAAALARHLELRDPHPTITSLRTGVILEPAQTVGDSGLVSGDEVVVGVARAVRAVGAMPSEAVTVDVLAGPDAGSSAILLPGTFSVGRGGGAGSGDRGLDIALSDPTVSRHHLDVIVDEQLDVTVRLVADARNGIEVNGTRHDEPEEIAIVETDVVSIGGSRLAFRRFVRSDVERVDQLGQIEFQRTPYRPPTVAAPEVEEFGPIPTRPEPRPFRLLAAIAPLGAGLTLFAFSRQPQFLALTLMSPLVLGANTIEDKRSGKKKFATELITFAQRLRDWRTTLVAHLGRERIDRVRASPDLADLARRAELRTVDLWSRGRESPDFLRVRAGLGSVDTQFEPTIARGGDDELRTEALQATVGLDRVHGVPITLDLARHGVVGIHGPDDVVTGVASSMMIQVACLHSPEDVTIVACVDERPIVGWLKWLPHVRSVVSPLSGRHVVTTRDETNTVVNRLLEVAAFRRSEGDRELEARRWPWIVALIDARLRPDPSSIARLLDECPEVGISVIWIADNEAGVPRQAREVLVARREDGAALVGTLWSTDPDVEDREIEVEQLRTDVADRVARALAPVRDASTGSLVTAIPRTVPLLDVLGVGRPTPQWISTRWNAPRTYGLAFPVGVGPDGIFSLDLVHDGPHALIGGTSGAGKSELLQSIVGSLAAHHPPTRLNFLFVDYKGGASSNVFSALPHTVGYVTNLSAELSVRALTSLRAELNRRMAVMEGRAKDLAEMLDVAPDEAPASLVIIVDEFATLVKEVPEFVAGVVDIAQRGRSLGIHLILATQRPSGSVNENILANTNLRISLRMLDRTESTAVIGSPEAADLPVPLKGRGYARLGPSQLIAFQSAFCGAPLTSDETQAPVLVSAFEHTDDSPKSNPGGGPPSSSGAGRPPEPSTHLEALLEAIDEASAVSVFPDPVRPWRDVLAPTITLDAVLADGRAASALELPGRHVAVGMIDAPERQDQYPAVVDLESGGGLLVFGSGGAGKTTLLRTAAVSVAACGSSSDVVILGFDYASRGLGAIRQLAPTIDVVTGDDLEASTRHLATLYDELVRRRNLLADANAEHLTAYNERHEPLPRILLLIDGFGGFISTFGESSGGSLASAVPLESWLQRLLDVVVDGRQVGIHAIITAVRRNEVPARLHSAIANRLIMRHADETGYAEHGIPTARSKGLELAPGRGLWQGDKTVQVATISRDHSARSQGDFLSDFAQHLGGAAPTVLASRPLPEVVHLDEVPTGTSDVVGPTVVIGVSDITGAPVEVDLSWSNFTVTGPPRSGRSTVLAVCASRLADTTELWGIGQASSPLDAGVFDELTLGRADDLVATLERLVNLVEMGPGERRRVLIVDDLDVLDDPQLNTLWDRISKNDDIRVIASVETRSMAGYTQNPLINVLRRARRLLFLQPADSSEFLQVTGMKAPVRPGVQMPPGRGVLIADRRPSVVQVAQPR